jgi:sec-independent protein translocase protein TatB
LFDLGWTELLLIGIVALIVVGPKDLPGMFRTLGKLMARVRAMARDFQRSMEEAADSSGASDIAVDLKNLTSPKAMGLDAIKNLASSSDDGEEVSKQLEATKAEMAKVQKKHTEELAKKNQATSKKIEEFTKNSEKKQKISSKKSIKKKMNE